MEGWRDGRGEVEERGVKRSRWEEVRSFQGKDGIEKRLSAFHRKPLLLLENRLKNTKTKIKNRNILTNAKQADQQQGEECAEGIILN